MKIIEPSLLAYSKDEKTLIKELKILKEQGITSIHYDVMDGIFVPNIAFEGEFIELIHSMGFEITVHLMVQDVKSYVERFLLFPIKALTFQCEPINIIESLEIIAQIKAQNILAGIAIKPNTEINIYKKLLMAVDLITFMSVFPGKGGQMFIPESIERLDALKKIIPTTTIIQIDGGINKITMLLVRKYVDWFVLGSFSHKNIDQLSALSRELNDGK